MNKYKKLVNYISENDYPINLDDLIHVMYLSGWSKRQMINYFGKDMKDCIKSAVDSDRKK